MSTVRIIRTLFFLTTLALCRVAAPSAALETIHDVEITREDGRYVITYDLSSQVPGFVDLLGSSDGGRTFDLVMEHVTGDCGEKRVFPGRGLRIVWNAAKDLGEEADDTDLVVYPFFSFRRQEYQEENEVGAVRTKAEYQEEIRQERETYTQWILDNEASVKQLMHDQQIMAQRLSGLHEQAQLYGFRAARMDDREGKKAERAEKQRLKEVEQATRELEAIDREIAALQDKIRQLKFERGKLE